MKASNNEELTWAKKALGGQFGTYFALRVDHVGILPEVVAQIVVDVTVEEATLPALFPPKKVILESIV